MLPHLPRVFWLVVLAASLCSCAGAAGHDGRLLRRDWQPNQVNTTMCTWEQPRSAVVRDTLYLDGGYLSFIPGYANGSAGTLEQPEDGSVFYAINFTQPFNTSQNASEIIQTKAKTAGAANNIAPNFYDGMMFANEDEFYMYGGLLRDTDSIQVPESTVVLGYEAYQYGPYRQSWSPGLYQGSLPDNMTRYVTAGAGVNVPSENLGFYFSGLRAPNWGEIRVGGKTQYNATVLANSLISIDMTTMRREAYQNRTIDSSIPARANAELVWIPQSDQGLLVAIGGVINPEWAYLLPSDKLKVQSQNTSPGFMKTVAVYDIANNKWYSQDTSGDTPPQLTQFCSVVASAKDGSSHNVYIYGGWDGLEDIDQPSDDVYILSIPSFVWVKAVNGTSAHGRRSHKCAAVYPDQMFVVGGQTQQLDTYTCLDQGMIQIFNLNTLVWQDQYDPTKWAEYQVPSVVTAKIGGSSDGGATATKPSKWSDNDLSTLFGSKYTKTVPTYYPYKSVQSTNSPTPTRISTSVPTPVPHSGGVPSFVAPLLGVVLGLVVLTALLTCILMYRRRKYFKRYGGSSVDGTSNFQQARVWDWISGNPPQQVAPGKEGTVTSSTEEPSSVSAPTATASTPHSEYPETGRPLSPELGTDSQIHELAAPAATYELATMQTGMTPAATTNPNRQSGSRPSLTTSTTPRRGHSPRPPLSTTSSAGTTGSDGVSATGLGIQRPDSPTTSTDSIRPDHLRQVSSSSSVNNQLRPSPSERQPSAQESPGAWEREGAITPPSAEPGRAADPMDRAGLLSPVSPATEAATTPQLQQQQRQQRRRKSSFAEHVE